VEYLRKYTSGVANLFEDWVPKFPTKFEEVFFSRAHGNVEEKNKAFESSTIIIYYITVNASYKLMRSVMHF